jgi:4-alpha-glucanotransferase
MPSSRASGVLLHPTSLPGPLGSGDFGPAAYHFVDWLVVAGQSLWQILPLGGIGLGNSPYMSSSAFAGNVLLIDLGELQQRGWLAPSDLVPDPGFDERTLCFDRVIPFRMARLARAALRFDTDATAAERADLAAFAQRHVDWLPDYALFMALADHHDGQDWTDWDPALATRQPAALTQARIDHAARIHFWVFCQWCFFRQWAALRAYANRRGVRLIGDAPIFIALQSAEVWARPDLFELDASGQPTVVAGVPPDLFAATGQRWGNPLYRWSAHARDGYAWWVQRLRGLFELVDWVRIDHFRGFAAHWEIPASEPTAMQGRWVPGPGAALFQAVTDALGPVPIIAEDLGVITPDVDALRKAFAFPGMRILQFAWGEHGEGDPHHLPHRHAADSVVYTGSHDNDTAIGWWDSVGEPLRHHLREYLATDGRDIAGDLIRAACASVANTALYPLQDVLRLSGAHRMNKPGQPEGCWAWRFTWADVRPEHADGLHRLCQLYGRLPAAA